jgi:hypothetical protein
VLVEMHGGHVEATSTLGHGSIFSVYLPTAPAAAGPAAKGQSLAAEGPAAEAPAFEGPAYQGRA